MCRGSFGLDEFTIAALRAAPVDSFGVGTSVVTGSGYPAAGMVYKLVARNDPERGWYGGQYETTGKPNTSINANTNAVVLQSMAFIEKGPFIRYH